GSLSFFPGLRALLLPPTRAKRFAVLAPQAHDFIEDRVVGETAGVIAPPVPLRRWVDTRGRPLVVRTGGPRLEIGKSSLQRGRAGFQFLERHRRTFPSGPRPARSRDPAGRGCFQFTM